MNGRGTIGRQLVGLVGGVAGDAVDALAGVVGAVVSSSYRGRLAEDGAKILSRGAPYPGDEFARGWAPACAGGECSRSARTGQADIGQPTFAPRLPPPLFPGVASRFQRFAPSGAGAAAGGRLFTVSAPDGTTLFEYAYDGAGADGAPRYHLLWPREAGYLPPGWYATRPLRRLPRGASVVVIAGDVLAQRPYSPYERGWAIVSSSPAGAGMVRTRDLVFAGPQAQIR